MARELNPHYIRRIMEKSVLTRTEALMIATEGRLGLSEGNGDRFDPAEFLGPEGADGPDGWDSSIGNYRGWSVPGKLYCVKCWAPIQGVPRDILLSNRCPSCGRQLYDPDDTEHLDYLGFCIYRKHVERYTDVACRVFAYLIEGSDHLRVKRNGDYVYGWGTEDGFECDHIYSKRRGFEEDVQASVISAPPNLRVITQQENQTKKGKCGCSLEELQQAYTAFVEAHPEWPRFVKDSDEKESE